MPGIGSSGSMPEGMNEKEWEFFKDAFCKKESSLGRLRSFDLETKTKSVTQRLFHRSDISHDKDLYQFVFNVVNDKNAFDKLNTQEQRNCLKNMNALFSEILKVDPHFSPKKKAVIEKVEKYSGGQAFESLSEKSKKEIKEKGAHDVGAELHRADLLSQGFTQKEIDEKSMQRTQFEQKKQEEKELQAFLTIVKKEPFAKDWSTMFLIGEATKVHASQREMWLEQKRAEYQRQQQEEPEEEGAALRQLGISYGVGPVSFKSNHEVIQFIEVKFGVKRNDPEMQAIIAEIFRRASSASSTTPRVEELLSEQKSFPANVQATLESILVNKEFNHQKIQQWEKLVGRLHNDVELREDWDLGDFISQEQLFRIQQGFERFPDLLIQKIGDREEKLERNIKLLNYIRNQFDEEAVLPEIFRGETEDSVGKKIKDGRLEFPSHITEEYLAREFRVWKKESR